MTYVPRAIASSIRRAMRTFPAVLVTGPRQQTCLERDLRNIEHVGDPETFRAFFSLTCAASG